MTREDSRRLQTAIDLLTKAKSILTDARIHVIPVQVPGTAALGTNIAALITDMTNAGRRGKRCRVLRVLAVTPELMDLLTATPEDLAERDGKSAYCLACRPVRHIVSGDYNAIRQIVIDLAAADTREPEHMRWYDEEIRAIDAPRETLVAGIENIWSGQADESGVYLADLTDHHNDPREITPHDQKPSEAYRCALLCWDLVRMAKTMHEASTVLRNAGCSLHYYCVVD